METKNEIWKDIEGYEGYYQVSNLGRVKSLERIIYQENGLGDIIAHKYPGKIRKQCAQTNGYLSVGLHKDAVTTLYRVHRLVAEAFVKGYCDGYEVNHIDEDKTNNAADNLEWVSRGENLKISTALVAWQNKLARPIIQMTLEGKFVKRYKSISQAARETGLHRQGIRKVCKGKYQTSGGYLWKYADK